MYFQGRWAWIWSLFLHPTHQTTVIFYWNSKFLVLFTSFSIVANFAIKTSGYVFSTTLSSNMRFFLASETPNHRNFIFTSWISCNLYKFYYWSFWEVCSLLHEQFLPSSYSTGVASLEIEIDVSSAAINDTLDHKQIKIRSWTDQWGAMELVGQMKFESNLTDTKISIIR